MANKYREKMNMLAYDLRNPGQNNNVKLFWLSNFKKQLMPIVNVGENV